MAVLAGCTPPETGGWVALRMSEGGEIMVVTSPCVDEHIDSISVYTQDEPNGAWWDAIAPLAGTGSVQGEFTLFQVPSGWEVGEAGEIMPLVEGVLYGFAADTAGYPAWGDETRSRRSRVDFTLALLRGLEDDDVLVTSESDEGEVKSMDEFVVDAQATC